MCCRACHGYDACQSQKQLREDCCAQCAYFADCMENDVDEQLVRRDMIRRTGPPNRRPARFRK